MALRRGILNGTKRKRKQAGDRRDFLEVHFGERRSNSEAEKDNELNLFIPQIEHLGVQTIPCQNSPSRNCTWKSQVVGLIRLLGFLMQRLWCSGLSEHQLKEHKTSWNGERAPSSRHSPGSSPAPSEPPKFLALRFQLLSTAW